MRDGNKPVQKDFGEIILPEWYLGLKNLLMK